MFNKSANGNFMKNFDLNWKIIRLISFCRRLFRWGKWERVWETKWCL